MNSWCKCKSPNHRHQNISERVKEWRNDHTKPTPLVYEDIRFSERATMLSKMKTLLRNITVEPAMFSYFLAIYLLYSVFHPTVMNRYLLYTYESTLVPINSISRGSFLWSTMHQVTHYCNFNWKKTTGLKSARPAQNRVNNDNWK